MRAGDAQRSTLKPSRVAGSGRRALSQIGGVRRSAEEHFADLRFARFDCSQWVGSTSSTDRTADLPGAWDVDRTSKTVNDRFGEWSRSGGRRPMAAVL